jgi:magnesium transporter
MITYLKNNTIGLERLQEPTNGCWINIIDPSEEEINQILASGVPQDYIAYSLDIDERARTEKEIDATLIVVRIPHFQGKTSDVPYTTIPLGIILTEDCLITICKIDNAIIQELSSGQVKKLTTLKRNRFVLHLLLLIATKYLGYLREITKAVDALEDQLERSMRNKEMLELLKYEKSLTYFATGLKSNELMMERLQRSQLFLMYPEDEELLEDVLTENQQAIEITNITSNILNSMMDAFASIISNNLNTVMKFLASITIVLSIPTMIASFYGMNLNLPLENSAFAFAVILAFSLGISVTVALVFVRHDWL